MISVIITSYKEPDTIGKAIKCVADSKYSGIPNDFEVIQISPDKETLEAGLNAAKELKLGNKFKQLIDPHKGKPFALNYAFKEAKGDILILTDGEVFFEKDAIKYLLQPYENEKVGGVTGRPLSMNPKNTFYGYMSNLLVDSAHHKRIHQLNMVKDYYVSGKNFFPMSGYILSMRKGLVKELAQELLTEDAYMSYEIREKRYEIAYAPKAMVVVKYPTSFKDYYAQKVRALGGHVQIDEMKKFKRDSNTRTIFDELHYTFFVLKYAKSFKEFMWSLWMFPTRLAIWLGVYIEVGLLKKGTSSTGWKRIESTK